MHINSQPARLRSSLAPAYPETSSRRTVTQNDTQLLGTDVLCAGEKKLSLSVTVVIPLFNEELVVPFLCARLADLEASVANTYQLHFVFVDDGSTDGTWDLLKHYFGEQSHCALVQHEHNRGIAAAIMTGIRTADTGIVCSIDCDCTYDVEELVHMIPLLTPGVAMVTASPYHALGTVENVSPWRLLLSRCASGLYRIVLRNKLSTYTSCFRVYRRSAVLTIATSNEGFAGIAELLGQLDLHGELIVEHPATLRLRTLGTSKIRIFRTTLRHLMLLSRLAFSRLRHSLVP